MDELTGLEQVLNPKTQALERSCPKSERDKLNPKNLNLETQLSQILARSCPCLEQLLIPRS